MFKQHNAQRCSTSCCLYLNGQPVTEAEYKLATDNAVSNGRDTIISCLKAGPAQQAAKQAGFYIGIPLGLTLIGKLFVYDLPTNTFLREATADDFENWRRASNATAEPKSWKHY